MDNKTFIKKILKMTIYELLDLIFANPEYLIDPYYTEFGNAMTTRYNNLKKEIVI